MIGGIFSFIGIGFLGLGGAFILINKQKNGQSHIIEEPPEPPKNDDMINTPPQPEDMKPPVPRPPIRYGGDIPPPY